MKRIQSACICQTLRFFMKDDESSTDKTKKIREEIAAYLKTMDRSRIQYRILEDTEQSDGSVRIKIIKQYNQSPVGNYLD